MIDSSIVEARPGGHVPPGHHFRTGVATEGAVLATEVELPVGAGAVPASLFRTPYGRGNVFPDPSALPGNGVALVNQDVRGRWGSTGTFALGATDIGDGVRAVEWLTEQAWCDGRVVGRGLSYPGLMQWAMALGRPRGLVCIAPMMAPAFWRGMSLREGGALQLALAAHWLTRQAAEAPGLPDDLRAQLFEDALEFEDVVVPTSDGTGRWETSLARCLAHRSLTAAPLADPNRFAGAEPFATIWRQLFEQPDMGNWFTDTGPAPDAAVEVPVLVMSGWYDVWSHEATVAFRHLQVTSSPQLAAQHRLVIAPFGHGTGWAGELPEPIDANRFACNLDIRWSLEWLFERTRDLRDLAPVTYYCYNLGWRDAVAWPPPRVEQQRWYIDGDNRVLTLTAAPATSRSAFVYDPTTPVPSRGGRALGLPAGPCRQDGISGGARADVLSFDSEPLSDDVVITGSVLARLMVTSSAPHTDFTVKLVDVHPDGVAYSICDGICRTRFRDGRPSRALSPSVATDILIHLGSTAFAVLAGHRLRLDVSSSNFPWYDLSPNVDLPEGSAQPAQFRPAQQVIWSGPGTESYIQMTVISGRRSK
ncbi:MAG: CocE/NonD family hydrolase [Candidatus Dormibacteria bacterium]